MAQSDVIIQETIASLQSLLQDKIKAFREGEDSTTFQDLEDYAKLLKALADPVVGAVIDGASSSDNRSPMFQHLR